MAKTPSPKAAKPAVTKTVKPKVVKRENPAGNPTLHGDEPAKPAVTGLEGEAKVEQKEAAHEAAAPTPVVDETPAETPAVDQGDQIPNASSDFDDILADIKAGKEVTIEGEPGVYFRYEDNRLKKFSKQGGHMDSYPLYAFQERKGWALKK